MIDDRTGMAMALGFFAGAEHVNLALHGRQRRSSGHRVGIVQHNAVVRIARLLADFVQGAFRIRPFVAEGGRLDRVWFHPRRAQRADRGKSVTVWLGHRLFLARVGLVKIGF